MEIQKIDGTKYNIRIGSDAFLKGYDAGCNHPAFLIGNTLKEAPESDDINPFKKDSDDYWDWRIAFNSAIL